MDDERPRDAHLMALLDDLLRLDQEAVEVYTAVMERLDDRHHDTLVRFRGDHQRHMIDLCRLIRARGGCPTRLAAGPDGTARAVREAGSRREALRALRTHERRLRARYARVPSGDLPPDVARVIARNAIDEGRHCAWVSGVLRRRMPATADLVDGAGRTVGATERLRPTA